jgi:hypothetical protein
MSGAGGKANADKCMEFCPGNIIGAIIYYRG